jgi:hypothetical protein
MKIAVDYDFMTKSEIKITPIEYYLSYNKNHHKRNNILVNSNDSILTVEYTENDKTRKIKYYKNKFGSFLKYLRYDSNSNMNYELSSFDRVVVYNHTVLAAASATPAVGYAEWIRNVILF